MDNAFLQANIGKIEKMDKPLLRLEMMGSYAEVPTAEIRHLMQGMKLEISKLQGEVNEIKKLLGAANANQQQGKHKGKGK
jgi:hypothetical protein